MTAAHAEHLGRLRLLYGTPAPTQPDAEQLRRQLAACADSAASMIAEASRAPTPERLEALGIRLAGIARLAGSLRASMAAEGRDDG